MPELPKEELDKVFREGADQYDFPFKPEAWEHMESLLDRDRRRRAILWWWLGALGLLVLILGLNFLLITPKASEGNVADQQSEQTAEPTTASEALPKTESQDSSPDTHPPSEPDPDQAASPGSGKTANGNDSATDKLPKTGLDPVRTPASGLPRRIIEGDESVPNIQKVENGPDATNANKKPERPIVFTQDPEQERTESERAEQWLLSLLPILDHRIASMHNAVIEDSLFQPKSLNVKPGPKSTSKLIFGLVLSPELVSVGWDDFSRAGFKGGVVAEYLYFGRLGLSAGVNYLRKSYLAGEGEYHPPYGFWVNHTAPIKTDGTCSILEIPVMLTVYARGYDQPGFYGSFGASSYIMLSENYNYIYDVPDPDLIRYWGSNEALAHWMSMLNFSIGHSGFLSDRLGYRLGIYGQTPLVGVGHGEVKLHSVGLNLILNFQRRPSR